MNDKVPLHLFFQKTVETAQCIKNLAKSDPIYSTSWEAVEKFIDTDVLAAFIAGRKPPNRGM